MAGTLNIALTQQFDINGVPLSGGLLYFYQAASTIPQNAFQDIALTILHPNPIILPADGRVPMFYLASTASEGNPSGQIKIRLTDFTGVVILAADSLLIIGPASGGGSSTGGGVDATSVFGTGDIKPHFGTEDLDGWVPCNGETIGSELSSAKYFGAEMEFLFKHLWNTGVLQVFAGTVPARGATANDDWDANRRIVLPDLRGRVLAGLDDMGSTEALRLTAAGFGTVATVLGNVGGAEAHTLVLANLPTYTPAGTVDQVSGSGSSSGTGSSSGSFSGSISGTASGITVAGNYGNTPTSSGNSSVMASSAGGGGVTVNIGDGSVGGSCGGNYSGGASVSGSASISGGTGRFNGTTINPTGATATPTMSPAMVMTLFIKL